MNNGIVLSAKNTSGMDHPSPQYKDFVSSCRSNSVIYLRIRNVFPQLMKIAHNKGKLYTQHQNHLTLAVRNEGQLTFR